MPGREPQLRSTRGNKHDGGPPVGYSRGAAGSGCRDASHPHQRRHRDPDDLPRRGPGRRAGVRRGDEALQRRPSISPTGSSTACAPAARSPAPGTASATGAAATRSIASRSPSATASPTRSPTPTPRGSPGPASAATTWAAAPRTSASGPSGLRNDVNGENLACMWAAPPRRMVVYWMRHWYKETDWGGAHWHQIKDPDFRVGRLRGGQAPQRPDDPRRQLLRQVRRLGVVRPGRPHAGPPPTR